MYPECLIGQEMARETVRARELYPAFHSEHEAYAVLLEEIDELWDEIKRKQSTPGRKEKIRAEAIQAGAMLIRMILDCQE